MIIVKHRVNTINEIKKINKEFGVEIDLRSNKSRIYLHHDPFKKGEDFSKWLKFYNHKLLVLNVKEEGLEKIISKILKKKKIYNYFFHDQTFSSMLKNMKSNKVSVRFSEYEKLEKRIFLFKYIKWIWIDNFTHLPKDQKFYTFLKKNKIKTCIVSPELVKISRKKEISQLRKENKKFGFTFDAVCTKKPLLWK
jgi:hypothetical protein